MQLFNAIQLVLLLILLPFGLAWLWTGPFPYALAAFWVCLVGWIVLFVWVIYMVWEHFEKGKAS